MHLFGLVNKRGRANLLVADLFTRGKLTLLSDKHLLGVLIAGVEAISPVGEETSFAGVASKELMHFLSGVASEALVHVFGELVEEVLNKEFLCVETAAFLENRL